MSSLRRLAACAFMALAFALAFPRDARAGTCDDGICDPGEDSQNCPADCACPSFQDIEYGLCCCCSNGPNPQGQCTIKALCMYSYIGGCCCIQFDPLDPFTCLVCTDNDPIPDWCAGLGAYEGNGSCGPASSPTCDDTEMTDDFIDGVDVRTRCAVTTIPLGAIEGGIDGFSVDVNIVYNEARPPPAELYAGFPNANTGPYGVGGWLSVDKIFTDEGIYWKNTDDSGQPTKTGVLNGTRGDRNGNGYVGYTLHTPYGDRTYDYPVVADVPGAFKNPVGLYRSEPFDGWLLWIDDLTKLNPKLARRYILFRYPNGPYEYYDSALSKPNGETDFDPADPVRSASVYSEMRMRFGPVDHGELKAIKIWRGYGNEPQNWVKHVASPPGLKWMLYFKYGAQNADGGMTLDVTRDPGKLLSKVTMTQAMGYRPETFTAPGRAADDSTKFEWDEWRIKSIDAVVRDAAKKTTFESKALYARDADMLKIASETISETMMGFAEGDDVVRFESCDVSGAEFQGTTVSMPRDVRLMFEYGGDDVQHRLVAQTDATGVRTQYVYSDKQTEPRGELVDAVKVPGPTDPKDIGSGFGTHIDWTMVEQIPLDPSLYPPGTFVGAPTSKGVPVRKTLTRWPDGLVLRATSDYDVKLFMPQTVVDERGLTYRFTFYDDTGELASSTKAGVKTEFLRTFAKEGIPKLDGDVTDEVEIIDTYLVGAEGKKTFLGKSAWDLADGTLYRQEKLGWQLDPDDPVSGKALRMKIMKRVLRGAFGAPGKVQTFINDKLTAETAVAWDAGYQGPAKSESTLNGEPLAGAAPMGKGTDGLGGVTGTWQVAGPGESLAMFGELDPLGNLTALSGNGIGGKLKYAAGPKPSSIKTSLSRLAPNREIPEEDEVESAGTTAPVCK